VPSHRADTPADAPIALRTRPSAHPTHPPVQRRRDLRARGTVPAGHGTHRQQRQGSFDDLDAVHEPAAPALPVQRPVPGSRVAAAWASARPVDAPTSLLPAPLLPAGWPQDPPVAPAPTVPVPAPLPVAAPLPVPAPLPIPAPLPVPAAAEPLADPATSTGSLDVETVGALALDPLFLATPSLDVDAGLVDAALVDAALVDAALVDAALVDAGPVDAGPVDAGPFDAQAAPVQPLRRPRGKARAQAQTTRRAAQVLAEPQPRRATATLPQAGIAGALGIATIAVPLAGTLGLAPGTRPSPTTASTAAAAALTPLPPVPLVATPSLTALGDRRLLPARSPVTEVPKALAARRVRVTTNSRASRSTVRPVLPGCDGKVPDVHGVQNGRLPASMLCTLWDPKRQLRSDAAVAMAKLNVAYTKRFGHPICFNDAYRSLLQQYRIKALRGGYAARPGTSEHGWGLAADLCDGVDDGPGSATYAWLRAHAAAYGWQNPTWARSGGSGPYEPWHWEYMPGEQGLSNGD
jgi:hypothetical protein